MTVKQSRRTLPVRVPRCNTCVVLLIIYISLGIKPFRSHKIFTPLKTRDGTILNITESMRYYTIQYCYHLYIALDDNIEKAVISLVI